MTYGWAILIIAIVLGALFEIGIFNVNTFAPRAQAGACYVFRPKGAATTFDLGLAGVCNGDIPQYVASFDGSTGYVNITNGGALNAFSKVTVSVWAKSATSVWNSNGMLVSKRNSFIMHPIGGTEQLNFYVFASGGWHPVAVTFPSSFNLMQWHDYVGTFNGSSVNIYADGTLEASLAFSGTLANQGDMYIGSDIGCNCGARFFNGTIANVQVYNTSLSSNQVNALYLSGIGGAPISDGLVSLVGWWPLNGDSYDYSGNGYDGNVSGGVTYTSHWTSGYGAP